MFPCPVFATSKFPKALWMQEESNILLKIDVNLILLKWPLTLKQASHKSCQAWATWQRSNGPVFTRPSIRVYCAFLRLFIQALASNFDLLVLEIGRQDKICLLVFLLKRWFQIQQIMKPRLIPLNALNSELINYDLCDEEKKHYRLCDRSIPSAIWLWQFELCRWR